MIVVNTPGSYATTFSPLLHANWDGFTLTDLVFPTFLFIVGNAMSFSLPKFDKLPTKLFLLKITKRTLIIFLLGFLLYWFPFFENGKLSPIENTRIFGVLQRIALCYFFAAIILRFFTTKSVFAISTLILLGYYFILIGFGDLTLEGNATILVDKWLIGESHMYGGEGIPFDPEGLLSTLPAIVNVIAGFYAGKFLRSEGQNFKTISHLMMAGAVLIFIAFGFEMFFPFNKKLWSSSFVLLTAGIDCILLAMFVYALDIKKITKGTRFFDVFGKNPLAIYILSGLIAISLLKINVGNQNLYSWIAENMFMSWLGDYVGSLAFALFITFICWGVAVILDKRKIYIKV